MRVKELLPDKRFTLMIVVLKKFYEFLKLTANVSSFNICIYFVSDCCDFNGGEIYLSTYFLPYISFTTGGNEYSGIKKYRTCNQIYGSQ